MLLFSVLQIFDHSQFEFSVRVGIEMGLVVLNRNSFIADADRLKESGKKVSWRLHMMKPATVAEQNIAIIDVNQNVRDSAANTHGLSIGV